MLCTNWDKMNMPYKHATGYISDISDSYWPTPFSFIYLFITYLVKPLYIWLGFLRWSNMEICASVLYLQIRFWSPKCIILVIVVLLNWNITDGIIYKEQKLTWLTAWEAEGSKMEWLSLVRVLLLHCNRAKGITWVRWKERAEFALRTSPLWLQWHKSTHVSPL